MSKFDGISTKYEAIGNAPIGEFIVKLQIPLNTGATEAVIYDEKKQFMMFVPLTKEIMEVMQDTVKKYFKVHIDLKEKNIVFDNEVEAPGW